MITRAGLSCIADDPEILINRGSHELRARNCKYEEVSI